MSARAGGGILRAAARLTDAGVFLHAFAAARRGRGEGRVRLEARRSRALRRLLDERLPTFDYYRERLACLPLGASARERLAALPIVDKRTVLDEFERFNRPRWSLERAREAARRGASAGAGAGADGLVAGLSSGTSGPPAVFLTSRRERARWAGTVLARALSDESLRHALAPWRSPLRVALVLRANDALYERVAGRRLHLDFVALATPADERLAALAWIAPHVLVAPPSVLAALARATLEGHLPIRPRQVIGVAEALEADDADAVRAAWGTRSEQLYQCTEGLLGSSCAHGRLHLHEEHVLVEPEWLDAARERFTPIVTDLARETQAFVRYRLDDVLRIDPTPCPCGRQTLGLRAIEGRADDVLHLRDAHGRWQPVFPDTVRRALAELDPAPGDWRLEQSDTRWTLRLRASTSSTVPTDAVRHAAVEALERLCARLGLLAPAIHPAPWADESPSAKRRRVRCRVPPQALGSASDAIAGGGRSARGAPGACRP